jgi:hypothetical protein
VRVPNEAADGKVQVKLSFPAFKGFPVAATTGEFRLETVPDKDEPAVPNPAPVAPKPAEPPAPAK